MLGCMNRSSAASASPSPGAAPRISRQRSSAFAGSPSGPSSSARSGAAPRRAGVAPRRLRRQGQAPLEDVEPVAVPPLLVVEARQRLERAGILGVLVEDADAGGDGLLDVADVALEQARDLAPQLLARARVAGEVDALAQHLDALAVLRAGLEDPLEGVDRLAVLRSRSPGSTAASPPPPSVSPSDFSSSPAMRNSSALRVVGGLGPARLLAQDLDQRRDVAGLGVQGLERRRRRLPSSGFSASRFRTSFQASMAARRLPRRPP